MLDAGAGTGQLPLLLAGMNNGYRITGVDLSGRCVRVANEKAEKAGLAGRVAFRRGDLEKLDVIDNAVDLAVSVCSLHHWRRPGKVFGEMARVLAPGGEFWLMDDAAEASRADRAVWVAEVSRRAGAGLPFRLVFGFESRHLAYSREEIARLALAAGLDLVSFELNGVFFLARMRKGASC
jgi:ubiquinone/menaquinone biosynthesis C-methylase UbiE